MYYKKLLQYIIIVNTLYSRVSLLLIIIKKRRILKNFFDIMHFLFAVYIRYKVNINKICLINYGGEIE